MKALQSDLALYVNFKSKKIGLSGTYVNDILQAGTAEFFQITQNTKLYSKCLTVNCFLNIHWMHPRSKRQRYHNHLSAKLGA